MLKEFAGDPYMQAINTSAFLVVYAQ